MSTRKTNSNSGKKQPDQAGYISNQEDQTSRKAVRQSRGAMPAPATADVSAVAPAPQPAPSYSELLSTRPVTGSQQKPAKRETAVSATHEQLRQRIAERAFELYNRRGHDSGSALDDWLEAERQILGKAIRSTKA